MKSYMTFLGICATVSIYSVTSVIASDAALDLHADTKKIVCTSSVLRSYSEGVNAANATYIRTGMDVTAVGEPPTVEELRKETQRNRDIYLSRKVKYEAMVDSIPRFLLRPRRDRFENMC